MGTVNDFSVKADGSLREGAYWDRTIAEELARINGIWPLTANHWKVIDFVRQYYEEHGNGPTVHKIYKATGFRLQHLIELFPGAITWNAHCIAGLPHPGKEPRREELGFRSGADQALAPPLNSDLPIPAPERAEVKTESRRAEHESRWEALWEFFGKYNSFARPVHIKKMAWAAVLVVAVISIGIFLKTPQQNRNMQGFATVPMTRIEATAGKGLVEVPLDLVKQNKLVSFEYKRLDGPIPLLAYLAPSGKIVTAIGLSEPCNSKSFHIEGNEIVCNLCLTRWNLETLEAGKGDCPEYPPEMLIHTIHDGRLILREFDLQYWKPRPV